MVDDERMPEDDQPVDAAAEPEADAETAPEETIEQVEAAIAQAEVDGDDATVDALREQLAQMREEADRIAALGTGDEQVVAAERFAEDAGRLDEAVGAAARAADEDGNR